MEIAKEQWYFFFSLESLISKILTISRITHSYRDTFGFAKEFYSP